MILRLDPASDVRPYEQLRAQIAEQVRSGELTPGTTLPPVRKLASDLGIAPNTVARAYRELESSGYVQGQGRRGTVVAGLPRPAGGEASPGGADAVGADPAELTRVYVARMRSLGVPADRILEHLRAAL